MHATAATNWQRKRRARFRATFRRAPRLTVSEWADRHRQLSTLNSAEPGPWRTSRVPYLREVMDAVSDPEVRDIVLMKSARIGFTEGVLGNTIGYHIHQDPCPILLVQPSDGDAESWSKDNLVPMLTDSPALRGRVAEPRARDSGNTILSKRFDGGILRIVGATSPKGLRRHASRKVLFDEVDGYPPSAGSEGDPVGLGKKRAQTFWNRQYIYGSTPTVKHFSRIEKLFDISDKRRYYVPCPHCEHFQTLRWSQLKWETRQASGLCIVNPDNVCYECEACGKLIDELHKSDMVAAGEWRADNPDAIVRGYHINALYSLFDGASWPTLAQEWVDAQGDNDLLKVFINTVLGQTWEERGEAATPQSLADRAEKYQAEVPTGVGVLVAAVDVQVDRLELAVRGFGVGEESWLIGHYRIYGDPEQQDVWQRLEALRVKPWLHARGGDLRIRAMLVDSGYATDSVYRYVAPRQSQGVFPSKGSSRHDTKPIRHAMHKTSAGKREAVKIVTVGTHKIKDTLFSRLRNERPGPGYYHFCVPGPDGADREYFEQFAAEKLIPRKVNGRLVREYKQVRDRNEAIDLEVLCLAALYILGMGVRGKLAELAAAAGLWNGDPPPSPKKDEGRWLGSQRRGRGKWLDR